MDNTKGERIINISPVPGAHEESDFLVYRRLPLLRDDCVGSHFITFSQIYGDKSNKERAAAFFHHNTPLKEVYVHFYTPDLVSDFLYSFA